MSRDKTCIQDQVMCNIKNVNLTTALSQENKIMTNVLTYALFPAFPQLLLHLDGPPSECCPITFRFPFGTDDLGFLDSSLGSILDSSLIGSVMIQANPYPFSFTHDPEHDPQICPLDDWHDLALDHAMASPFSFHYPVMILFLGQNPRFRSADLYL